MPFLGGYVSFLEGSQIGIFPYSIGEYKIHVKPPAGLVLEDPSKDLRILILCTFGKLTVEGT